MVAMVGGGILAVNEARKKLKYPSTGREEDDLPITLGSSNPIDVAVTAALNKKPKQEVVTAGKMLELTEGVIEGEPVLDN